MAPRGFALLPEGTYVIEAIALPAGSSVTLGRAATCTVRIPDAKVSQKHCELSVEGGGVMVIDMSTNGTFLDSCRIGKGNRVPMRVGSTLTLLNPASHEASSAPLFRLRAAEGEDSDESSQSEEMPLWRGEAGEEAREGEEALRAAGAREAWREGTEAGGAEREAGEDAVDEAAAGGAAGEGGEPRGISGDEAEASGKARGEARGEARGGAAYVDADAMLQSFRFTRDAPPPLPAAEWRMRKRSLPVAAARCVRRKARRRVESEESAEESGEAESDEPFEEVRPGRRGERRASRFKGKNATLKRDVEEESDDEEGEEEETGAMGKDEEEEEVDERTARARRRGTAVARRGDASGSASDEDAMVTLRKAQMDSNTGRSSIAKALAECERISTLICDELSKMTEVAKETDALSMASMPSLTRRARRGGTCAETDGAAKATLLGAPRTLTNEGGRQLKEYQLVGLNWLWLMWRFRFGGILADEMGLGKTVQVIALLCAISESEAGEAEPHLVVAPASTLDNWAREFAAWAPGLRVVKYHGPHAERHVVRARADEDGFDVLLTTYSYFEGDGSANRDDRCWLRRRAWGVAVLDEAHALKSSASSRSRRLSLLTTRQRLLLTGTPVQNNLPELLALLSFMLPALFPPHLAVAFASPPADDDRPVRRARRLLAPFILRRKKSDVLSQLSAKVEEELPVQMGSAQRRLYASLLARARTSRWRASSKHTASLFFDLRKAANHPCLLAHHFAPSLPLLAREAHAAAYFGAHASLRMVEDELASYSDWRLHQLCVELPSLARLALPAHKLFDSAKLRALAARLPSLRAAGHRALIFSQSTQMLDILQAFLRDELRLSFVRLDGATPVTERQQLIDAYQQPGSDIFAFLLSTRAGGQGINLTSADTVIIHDLDWNPQLDRQAEDRAHRIGQTKEVRVIRMVTSDTVEENILRLQQQKKTLDAKVLDGALERRKAHGRDELADSQQDDAKLDLRMMSAIIEQALAAEAQKLKQAE
ncbi:hypothetical protein AB1Y20_005720 [Prymnesium parvum]|uniref:Uncharacterized protein n=1 Tax=Prymnesium parvum TaxID=97485 RepID=A0AB34J061_PRYPA